MYRNIFLVGGWTIASRLTGLPARRRARRAARRRRAQRRLCGGDQAAQPVPSDLRRRLVQRRLFADLYPRARSQRPGGGRPLREPGVHAAHSVSDRAARSRLSRHAAARAADLARICEPAGKVRAGGRDVAHHVPVHRLHLAVRAPSGHSQRQQFLGRARFRASRGERLHDRLPRFRGVVSRSSRREWPAWRAGDFSPPARRSS